MAIFNAPVSCWRCPLAPNPQKKEEPTPQSQISKLWPDLTGSRPLRIQLRILRWVGWFRSLPVTSAQIRERGGGVRDTGHTEKASWRQEKTDWNCSASDKWEPTNWVILLRTPQRQAHVPWDSLISLLFNPPSPSQCKYLLCHLHVIPRGYQTAGGFKPVPFCLGSPKLEQDHQRNCIF